MAHTHHCEVCQISTAVCTDQACEGEGHANAGKHYCSIHHPDPAHRVEQAAPPPRYAVLVKDQKVE